eukprot:scaffold208843_cov20-Prasinocladus_malaysianus.AAC.2
MTTKTQPQKNSELQPSGHWPSEQTARMISSSKTTKMTLSIDHAFFQAGLHVNSLPGIGQRHPVSL